MTEMLLQREKQIQMLKKVERKIFAISSLKHILVDAPN